MGTKFCRVVTWDEWQTKVIISPLQQFLYGYEIWKSNDLALGDSTLKVK